LRRVIRTTKFDLMTKLPTVICLALSLLACKDKKQDTTPKNTGGDSGSKIDATLCESDGKRVSTYDLNKDGKDDVWRLYKGDAMSCKQIDFDHDGRKDWMVAYDPSGKILYQKADFDYDGKYDMAAVFDPTSGQRIEVERDTDFDGKFDIKELYTSGQLTGMRRDRNGDNKPDQWDTYTDGVLSATTYDDNFDGKVDRREDAPAGGQPQAATPLTPPAAGSGSGSSS
jgi:hypothetical protein